MQAERAQRKTEICSVVAESKNEVFETESVENKWNAMKEAASPTGNV